MSLYKNLQEIDKAFKKFDDPHYDYFYHDASDCVWKEPKGQYDPYKHGDGNVEYISKERYYELKKKLKQYETELEKKMSQVPLALYRNNYVTKKEVRRLFDDIVQGNFGNQFRKVKSDDFFSKKDLDKCLVVAVKKYKKLI